MEFKKRYLRGTLIGQGGMGEVYKAYDQVNKEFVVLKKLKNNHTQNFTKYFHHEILALLNLQHPNITTIFNYDVTTQDKFIVMEYVEGESLETLIKKRGFIEPIEAVGYIDQILDALDYIYQKTILHKDLKPSNIIINHIAQVKICDFGLASYTHYQEINDDQLKPIGTPFYYAPERYKGSKPTVKSEIFSLGVILFEMLTGNKPFNSKNKDCSFQIIQKEIMNQIINGKLPPLTIDIPQALENVVIKATAKKPQERYHSFKEMKQDLATVFSSFRKDEEQIKVASRFGNLFDSQIMASNYFQSSKKVSWPLLPTIFTISLIIILCGIYFYVS